MAKRSCDQDRRSNHCCWSDLPIDQLREVADRLSYLDFLRFAVVCKQWRRASLDDNGDNKIQRRPAMFLLRLARPSQHYYHDRPEFKTTYEAVFIDLLSKQRLSFQNSVWEERRQENPSSRFCCSFSNWVLYLKPDTNRSDRIFYVFDPFGDYETMHVTLLPPLDWNCGHRKVELAAFSTAPTCPGCVIFFLWKSTVPRSSYDDEEKGEEGEGEDHYFTITTYDLDYRRWSLYQLGCVNPDDYEFKDVVYAYGSFYCVIQMNSKVVLGRYNVALQEWDMMNSCTSTLRLPTRPTHLYLVHSDRKFLLAVFYYKDQQCRRELISSSNRSGRELFCHIYQFDLSQKNWIRVKNLGNRVLLLSSSTSSVAVSAASMVASKFANMVVRYSSCNFVLQKYTCNSEGEWEFSEKG